CDFGPTLAGEKLAQLHDCRVSRETLRKWMIEDGLWLDRRRRLPPVHQPRNRRSRIGELIQIDGSDHDWFEGRAPRCSLIAYIDDATSRLMHAAFVPRSRRLIICARRRAMWRATGGRSPSIPTSSRSFGSTVRTRPAA